MAEEITKVDSDTVEVTQTVENTETINVEEVKEKIENYEDQKEEVVAQIDGAIAIEQAKLDKAAEAGVVADGVVGEPTPEVPAEPVVEPTPEVPAEPTPEVPAE